MEIFKEELRIEEVQNLFKDKSLYFYAGWYESWDGTRVSGCIIMDDSAFKSFGLDHITPTMYFSEMECEKIDETISGNHYSVHFSRLVEMRRKDEIYKVFNGFAENSILSDKAIQYALAKSLSDKFGFTKENRHFVCFHECDFAFTKDKIIFTIPFSDAERIQFQKKELEKESKKIHEILDFFKHKGFPDAEDDMWYEILDNYNIQKEVFTYIRDHGHMVRIGGERDSFGWVTKGIFLDGKRMCLY